MSVIRPDNDAACCRRPTLRSRRCADDELLPCGKIVSVYVTHELAEYVQLIGIIAPIEPYHRVAMHTRMALGPWGCADSELAARGEVKRVDVSA